MNCIFHTITLPSNSYSYLGSNDLLINQATRRLEAQRKMIQKQIIGAGVVMQQAKLWLAMPAHLIRVLVPVPAVHFRFSSLLLCPGKQQVMAQLGPLPPTWVTGM